MLGYQPAQSHHIDTHQKICKPLSPIIRSFDVCIRGDCALSSSTSKCAYTSLARRNAASELAIQSTKFADSSTKRRQHLLTNL